MVLETMINLYLPTNGAFNVEQAAIDALP